MQWRQSLARVYFNFSSSRLAWYTGSCYDAKPKRLPKKPHVISSGRSDRKVKAFFCHRWLRLVDWRRTPIGQKLYVELGRFFPYGIVRCGKRPFLTTSCMVINVYSGNNSCGAQILFYLLKRLPRPLLHPDIRWNFEIFRRHKWHTVVGALSRVVSMALLPSRDPFRQRIVAHCPLIQWW